MKKIILSIAILGSALSVQANNFNMPGFGNNGSNWNMPNMNWGNGNGYNNGSSWNMPNMNFGNNNGYGNGSNWSMPNMNWGNSNGYNSGSNWSMPSMNWGNGNGYNNGSNWNMPNFNWNNNSTPWNNGYGYRTNRPAYPYAPNVQYRPPATRTFTPKARIPVVKPQKLPVPQVAKPAVKIVKPAVAPVKANKIPTPNEVKGVILAPENKPKAVEKASK